MSSGIILKAIILSSRNKRALRILRPLNRNRMIVMAHPVHHQLKSNVGLFSSLVRGSGGAPEWMPRGIIIASYRVAFQRFSRLFWW